MFWFQILFSFALWVLLGVVLAQRKNPLANLSRKLSRNLKILAASTLMLLCLAFLFLPLVYLATSGALDGGPMHLLAWIVITLSGGFFVIANTICMTLLVTVAREAAVTDPHSLTLTKQETHE